MFIFLLVYFSGFPLSPAPCAFPMLTNKKCVNLQCLHSAGRRNWKMLFHAPWVEVLGSTPLSTRANWAERFPHPKWFKNIEVSPWGGLLVLNGMIAFFIQKQKKGGAIGFHSRSVGRSVANWTWLQLLRHGDMQWFNPPHLQNLLFLYFYLLAVFNFSAMIHSMQHCIPAPQGTAEPPWPNHRKMGLCGGCFW